MHSVALEPKFVMGRRSTVDFHVPDRLTLKIQKYIFFPLVLEHCLYATKVLFFFAHCYYQIVSHFGNALSSLLGLDSVQEDVLSLEVWVLKHSYYLFFRLSVRL